MVAQDYDPQIGTALGAICSHNKKEFQQAIKSIHKEEKVYKDGEEAIAARKSWGLTNFACPAMLQVSLKR